jgi:hypothetical protein
MNSRQPQPDVALHRTSYAWFSCRFMAERKPRGVVSAMVLLFAYSWMMLCCARVQTAGGG